MTQGIVSAFNSDTGASGGGGGGGGDFALVSDDADNTTTGTNGVLATVGFNVPAGTADSFTAELVDKPPGSSLTDMSLTVVDTDAANPDVTFTPDALGRFVVRLVGTDADANEAQDTTVVQVAPDPPRLSAPAATSGGVDNSVVNVTFTNDGGAVASTSATLVKPEGSSATLTHSSPDLTASYTPDVPGVYGVEMDGTNGDGTSPKVVARRSVESRKPTADAGSNASNIDPGDNPVTLDGSGSAVHANSNGSLTYLWTFLSDDTATLSDDTAQSPTFTGVLDASYTLQLVVTDNESGESSEPSVVTLVMQATPMPAATADCILTEDLVDKTTSWANGTTYEIFENDTVTRKLQLKYSGGGNVTSSTIEITEANGAYLDAEWSGSGASANRRFIIYPDFPGATLNYNGRIILCALCKITLEGASGANPSTVRVTAGGADVVTDYNTAGNVGFKVREETSVAWSAIIYPTTTESASAAATGNLTTDPAGGYVLFCWAWDEAAPLKCKVGESSLPDNINDVAWDFEAAGTVQVSPAAGASNPFANGIAVAIYLNDDNTGAATQVSCEAIRIWTD